MLDDLRAATGVGGGAHFAGWAFNDFPLDLADPEQHDVHATSSAVSSVGRPIDPRAALGS